MIKIIIGIIIGGSIAALAQNATIQQGPMLIMPGGVDPNGLAAMIHLDAKGRVIAKCEVD